MRLAGAAICTLMGLYWIGVTRSGWPDPGWRFSLFLLLAALFPLLAAAAPIRWPDPRRDRVVRTGALGIAMFAGAGPGPP